MASPLLFKAPKCLSCIRRVSGLGDFLRLPASQQIRGKKKVAKATTINVKLRANVTGFGRKGSIVPVPPGVMRNSWFPRKVAEYQTQAQLKELGDVIIERDTTYGSHREKERIVKETRENQARQTVAPSNIQKTLAETIESAVFPEAEAPLQREKLTSEQAASIFAKLIPTNIDFYRTPLPPSSPPRKVSSSLAANSALSAAATAAAIENAKHEPSKPTTTGIYGSVSTADIAANLAALLVEDVEGIRVVITPEKISFVENRMELGDRIKHLGTFNYEVSFGSTERVRRQITVKTES